MIKHWKTCYIKPLCDIFNAILLILQNYLPADRVQDFNWLAHVLVNIERVNYSVKLESDFVISAPASYLLKGIPVILWGSRFSTNLIVGFNIKAIT